jgi:hypothetical protein
MEVCGGDKRCLHHKVCNNAICMREGCESYRDEYLSSHAVLDDVAKLLTEYTQHLYEFGYLDDDWIMEAPSPIHEFINKKFGYVV